MESSGFQSLDFWQNMKVYLFLGALFAVFTLILAIFSMFKSKIQAKV
jgi:hypothetical protein